MVKFDEVTRASDTFRSHFSNFVFALGRVFQFFFVLSRSHFKLLPILSHTNFHLSALIGYHVRFRVPKIRFCVRSR